MESPAVAMASFAAFLVFYVAVSAKFSWLLMLAFPFLLARPIWPWAVYPRGKLHMRWTDWLYGLFGTFYTLTYSNEQRRQIARDIENFWSSEDDTMCCLSVRTGFDLWLKVKNFPPKSQIILSGITIPDMIKVFRKHDIIPVPVDIDPATLSPDCREIEAMITPQTVAIMMVHIFGVVAPMQPIVDLAKKHKLLVMEDCAQAFRGRKYQGHPQSDVVMFSFGTIKQCTAFGGAFYQVRDRDVLRRMKTLEEVYAVRSWRHFFKRLIKYGLLIYVTNPGVYGLLMRTCQLLGANFDALTTASLRGFGGMDLFVGIRHQPETPLLFLLHYRLKTFEQTNQQREGLQQGQTVTRLVRSFVPDQKDAWFPGWSHIKENNHMFWLCPVVVANPQVVVKRCVARGFDATQGTTQLKFVAAQDAVEAGLAKAKDPANAKEIMQNLVYLGLYPEMPYAAIARYAQAVADGIRESKAMRTPQ